MAASEGHILANPNTGAHGLPVAAGSFHTVAGGTYVLSMSSSNWNGATADLQMLAPDGVTLTDAGGLSVLTANGNAVVTLPPCQVCLTVTGGPPTALYASLARVVG
jgi:hypothetical protein